MTDRIPFFKSTQTGGVARAFQPRLEEYISVKDFGAKGDGVTDDTAAIQAAINYANSIGGGSVMFPPALYYTTGTLTLKNNVDLIGVGSGPYDTQLNPMTNVTAPTLLVTNTTNPFVAQPAGALGSNVIANLLFAYPNQVDPTVANSPTVYPSTIYLPGGTCTIRGCTFVNGYDSIQIANGRCIVDSCKIGSYHIGIQIDVGVDYEILSNLQFIPLHDYSLGVSYPSHIDNVYCQSNSEAIRLKRCDGLQATNIGVFGSFAACITMFDGFGGYAGYGNFANVDLDLRTGYGINCQSSRSAAGGYHFSNLNIGASAASNAAILLSSGGSDTPLVCVSNGAIRGTWSIASTIVQAGTLIVENMRGLDVPQVNVTTPGFPGSGVSVTNTFPFRIQVLTNFNGAAVTSITINGTAIGTTPASMVLQPNATVVYSYSGGPPTWTWFTA